MTLIAAKNNCLLYLDMEGEHGSTVFTDRSPSGIVVTPIRVSIDTNSKATGLGSAKVYNPEFGAWLDLSNIPLPGDFTIEYSIKFIPWGGHNQAPQAYRTVLAGDVNITYGFRAAFETLQYPGSYVILTFGGKSWYWSYASYNATRPENNSDDAVDYGLSEEGFESHAFVRSGDSISFFKNGILQGAFTGADITITPTLPFRIGSNFSPWQVQYCVNAWVDDFRIDSVARYTEDFTPPSISYVLNDEALALAMSLSMDLKYSISYAKTWLPDYRKRWKITVDRTKFFTDRENYYLPILLCGDVGMNRADLSDVFTSVGSYANRKKIAVTLADQTTEIPVKIRTWDQDRGLADLYAVVPRVNGRDWHQDSTFYFYYAQAAGLPENPNVTDV